MNKKLIRHVIKERLLLLDVGETLNKRFLIEHIYGKWDFFLSRSFDVHFTFAKKEIAKEFPERKYKSRMNKFILRTN